MDWYWEKFSEESNFGESDQVSSLSDSIGSGGLESQKNGEEGILKGVSHESTAENRLSSSFHGSSKRTRLLNGTQNQTCLVDGCESDLSNCKEYHRRHRVCDFHSKTPVVIVRGEEKRFCQQCSRFHSLGEFDEVKRSCRKRLDGHNRRRRKPQPESLFMSSRDFLSNCKGPIVLQFGNPQIHVTDIGRSLWPAAARTEEKAMIPPNSSVCFNYGGDKQLPVLQKKGTKKGKQKASQISFRQPLPDTISAGNDLGCHKMLAADMSPTVVDSGCALYLLSSHSGQALPDAGLSSLVQSHQTLPVQTQESELQLKSLSEFPGSFGMKDKHVCKTNIHGDLMLEMEEPEGLFESEVPRKFPISWE